MTPRKIETLAKRLIEYIEAACWWESELAELVEFNKLVRTHSPESLPIDIDRKDFNGFASFTAIGKSPNAGICFCKLADYRIVSREETILIARRSFESHERCPRMFTRGNEGFVLIENEYKKPSARRLRHCIEDWRDCLLDAEAKPTGNSPDMESDTAKKQEKKSKPRKMNTKAVDCARRYREQKGEFPMESIVSDYVAECGGSVESILRILSDNPEQWKVSDTNPT